MIKIIEVERKFKRGRNPKPIKFFIENLECWYCFSHKRNKDGYPAIYVNKTNTTVHRWIYEAFKGKIPCRKIVRHTCDNRWCINPDHLLIGTPADNVKDKVSRNRQYKGEDHQNSKLKEYEVKEIFLNNIDITSVIAKKYKVGKRCIRDIKNLKNWSWLTMDLKAASQ